MHLPPGADRPPAMVAAEPPVVELEPVGSPARASALREVVPMWKRNDLIDHYERCNQALAAGRLDAAVTECREAVALWGGNHLAWYALGNAYAAGERWTMARDAYEH